MHRFWLSLLAATFFTFGAQLNADVVYTATLNGANETPPTGSSASGFAVLTLDGDSLDVNLSFTSLAEPASAAHIHCCVPPGANAIVALPFPVFPNAPSGTYNQIFDLSSSSIYNSAFLTANGGTGAGAEAALIAGLNAGEAYLNIHDAIYPGGEIRGFPATVPEPAYAGLLGLGLIGMAIARRFVRTHPLL